MGNTDRQLITDSCLLGSASRTLSSGRVGDHCGILERRQGSPRSVFLTLSSSQ